MDIPQSVKEVPRGFWVFQGVSGVLQGVSEFQGVSIAFQVCSRGTQEVSGITKDVPGGFSFRGVPCGFKGFPGCSGRPRKFQQLPKTLQMGIHVVSG